MVSKYRDDLYMISEEDVNIIMLHVRLELVNKLVSAKVCRFKIDRAKVSEKQSTRHF